MEKRDDNVCEHVMWYFGMGGFRPGSFTMALIDAIVKADRSNREKLRMEFPDYVKEVEKWQMGDE